jgi:hypothetical protein
MREQSSDKPLSIGSRKFPPSINNGGKMSLTAGKDDGANPTSVYAG